MAVTGTEEIRADMAPDIAAILVVLDLDDFGAEIGKLLRTEGAAPYCSTATMRSPASGWLMRGSAR